MVASSRQSVFEASWRLVVSPSPFANHNFKRAWNRKKRHAKNLAQQRRFEKHLSEHAAVVDFSIGNEPADEAHKSLCPKLRRALIRILTRQRCEIKEFERHEKSLQTAGIVHRKPSVRDTEFLAGDVGATHYLTSSRSLRATAKLKPHLSEHAQEEMRRSGLPGPQSLRLTAVRSTAGQGLNQECLTPNPNACADAIQIANPEKKRSFNDDGNLFLFFVYCLFFASFFLFPHNATQQG